MVPLKAGAVARILAGGDGPHRSVALRHAAIEGRPGLWGDHPTRPGSVAWLRSGDGQWEAFTAGCPAPALEWLVESARGRTIAMVAPPSWEGPTRALADWVERASVQTWTLPGRPIGHRPSAPVRRLGLDDASAFADAAPAWALRSWGEFGALIARGSAFGVPSGDGLAAVAWTFESNERFDKLGVATHPRYRRLGLGRSAASALAEHVAGARGKVALWTVDPANVASIALARSIGFSDPVAEGLLRWRPSATGG